MTPRYSIRAFDAEGVIVASAATGSLRAARHIAGAFTAKYGKVEAWEYKGMRSGVAMYELVTL